MMMMMILDLTPTSIVPKEVAMELEMPGIVGEVEWRVEGRGRQ